MEYMIKRGLTKMVIRVVIRDSEGAKLK